MHLVQILLPLRDAKGRGFPEAKFDVVAAELTDHFGDVTAYTRTPAEGRWKPGNEAASEEDVVVFEVMVGVLDLKWWRTYRKTLERDFRQKKVIVRAQDIQLLQRVGCSGADPTTAAARFMGDLRTSAFRASIAAPSTPLGLPQPLYPATL